ncbi:hypothetical protein [Photobacterium lutimaris]|uniref:Uncharacterized protein n=1 Tax=Photobacterium lutimaris TaxID=388278 RepID=A0A2T3ITS7_9GAMM|nr:hypothetical protein [Photobacterium lutimaris]PSU31764.1 hypothetical protein C9I99_21510 [Photobacterium lutimaris]TDR72585.1 hypothetical protein DFP78_11361 [Photobacterium lutimaris]
MKFKNLVVAAIASSLSFTAAAHHERLAHYAIADLHVNSKPVVANSIDRFFVCDFFHVSLRKSSARSPEVMFEPDVLAVLPSGNVQSVSLPEVGGRVSELEACFDKSVGISTRSDAQEFRDALARLYPATNGVIQGDKILHREKGVELVMADSRAKSRSFYVSMVSGRAAEVHVNYN